MLRRNRTAATQANGRVIAVRPRCLVKKAELPFQYGPLEPERFSLKEANQRLAKLVERGRFRA